MYSILFRNAIFPVLEKWMGTTIKADLAFLEKSQWWKPEQLEEFQNKKLRALINHAYKNVPYYHRLFRKLGLKPEDIKTKEDLKKLPILTKDDIRRNLSELLAKNIPKSRYIVAHSSGSTGEPLKYYVDKRAYSIGWAQTFRCWSWAGYSLGDPYVKISLNPRTKISKKIQDLLFRCTYIYIRSVDKNSIDYYYRLMQNATIIRGYASAMYTIANLIKEYVDNPEFPRLRAVMTTGDTLFPHYRRLIESVFQCEVFDGYGGESTPIAFECNSHSGYHICDESVIVEVLREGEEVSDGELGEIVFTSLYNYAMPFIRYNIQDVGRPSVDSCSCGRGLSMLKSVEGRNTDIVVTPTGKFLIVHFFTWLFEYIEGVDQFQVIQKKIDELNIKIVRNNKFTEKDLQYIISQIRKEVGDCMNIDVEFVDSIPPTRSGKRRFVISKVPLSYAWRKVDE